MKKRLNISVFFLLLWAIAPACFANPQVTASFDSTEVSVKKELRYTVLISWKNEGQPLEIVYPTPAFFGLKVLNRSEERETLKKSGVLWQNQSYHFTLQLNAGEVKAGVEAFNIEIKGENPTTLRVEASLLAIKSESKTKLWVLLGLIGVLVGTLCSVFWIRKRRKKGALATVPLSFEEDCSQRISALTFEPSEEYKNDLKNLFDALESYTRKNYNADLKKISDSRNDGDAKILESDRIKIEEFVSELTELRYGENKSKVYDAKRLAMRISSYIESKKIISKSI
jgi:hypothetical protein